MLYDHRLGLVVSGVIAGLLAFFLANGCTHSDVAPAGGPLVEEEVGFADDYFDLIDDCLDAYVACAVMGGDPAACVAPLRACVDAGDPLLDEGFVCPPDDGGGALSPPAEADAEAEESEESEEHDGDRRDSERDCHDPDDPDDPTPPPVCDEPDELVDFDGLAAGEVVDTQVAGITFACRNGNDRHPDTCLAFDTTDPTGGDVDLGTPNADFGGPGVGDGGEAGEPGENAVPLGMAVIIAEDVEDDDADGLVDDPDDEACGGTIELTFEPTRSVRSLTVLDIDAGERAVVRYTTSDGTTHTIRLDRPGDNSVQTVVIEAADVVSLKLKLPASGALADLTLGPICDDEPEECRPGLDRPAIGVDVDACIDGLESCLDTTPDFAECVDEARTCASRAIRGPLLPLCLRELDFCRTSGAPADECDALELQCDALGGSP